ncbi:hypothetical protein [Streptomyces sp. NPDC057250]|uniref:hypothetical protein n=1 Tax=Streptomyces sp. NPDC057250 TaxID=3346068 RepID=UPI00363C215B
MGAHLHVVPDPEPDEAPGPGERPVLVPVLAPVVPAPRQAPDLPDEPDAPDLPDEPDAPDLPDEPDAPDLPDAPDANEDQDDEDDAGEYEEEPAARALSVPDLRPYVDPRPLRELGPLAVEAGKTAGPPLLRAIGRLLLGLARALAWYGRGSGVLLTLLAGWLSGKYGKRVSLAARFGICAALIYAVVKLSGQYPYAPWVTLAVALLAILAAATGAIEVPASKPEKKSDGKGKAGKDKTGETPGKSTDTPAEESPETPEAEPAKASRGSLLGRLLHRPEPAPEAPADTPEEAEEEAPEEVEETLAEAPRGPSREDVIRSLHTLVGGGRGVLLTALRAHLSLPDTRAVKRVLEEAGITTRQGVRTVAGNGPGVHRDDFPELPSPQESTQGADVVAGHAANANANNAANVSREEADPGWTAEDLERGWRWIQDSERGPAAWKIQKLH